MILIWQIALNTFREVIRDRILYGFMIFAILLIFFSLALGQLSFAEQSRISADFGLFAIHISAVAIAIFVGCTIVFKEIEKKTIMTILVRPVSRTQFIIGKSVGLMLTVITVSMALAMALAGIFVGLGIDRWLEFAVAMLGIFFEASVLLGIVMFFSMFATPAMVVCFTVSVFLIGHCLSSLDFFANKSEGLLRLVNTVVQHTFPNLEMLDWKTKLIYGDTIVWSQVYAGFGLMASWLIVTLALSILLFHRKDLG